MCLEYLKHLQETGGFNGLLGLKMIDVFEGGATVLLPASKKMLNPIGAMHGGALFSLCDVAAGTAAASRGRVGVTLDASIHYLHSAPVDRDLYARATEVKSGKTIAVYLIDVSDDAGKQYVSATFTMCFTGMKTEELY